MVPSRGGWAQLCVVGADVSLIVVRSEGLWLWGGSAGAGTWGQVSIGTFIWVRGTSAGAVDGVCPLQEMTRQEHHIWSGMLEQGPDRQRAPDCCSGGGASINGASESRCSHVGPAQWSQQGLQYFRHWSSLRATGLHEVGLTVSRRERGAFSWSTQRRCVSARWATDCAPRGSAPSVCAWPQEPLHRHAASPTRLRPHRAAG